MRSGLSLLRSPLAAGLAVILFMASPLMAQEAAKTAETRAAVVNGTVITIDALNEEISRATQRFQGMGYTIDDAKMNEMRAQILDELIGAELLYQESHKAGIAIAATAIDAKLAELKKGFPNDEEFQKMMTQLNISEAGLRDKLKQVLAIEQLVETRVASKVVPTDKEIKEFYDGNPNFFTQPEQVRARHILIKVEPTADEATKKKAREEIEQVLTKAMKGDDFVELAKAHSQGPSAPNGGDLGFFTKERMVAPFSEAAFALQPGKISGVVETQFGFHIIKCEEKKAGSVVALETAKDRIQQFLKQQTVQQKVQELIEELKGKAKVEKFNS